MDVILELGGNPSRLYKVLELASKYPDSKIFISSESSPDYVVKFLETAGISKERYILDFNAWDTVTNFTATKKYVLKYQPKNIYVVTDKFHMKRSLLIAQAVYWLSGIRIIGIEYLGSEPHDPEPGELVSADQIRAWFWRLTGYLKYYPDVKEQRWPQIQADKKHSIECGYPVTE